MPQRRTPRPLRSAPRPTGPGSLHNYGGGYRRATPSVDFDWDRALYLNALTLRDLGYKLTKTQQKRIDDHEASTLSDDDVH